MNDDERFTWKTVHGWQTPAFLKVMNGLDKKNQQLKEENEQLKQELESFEQVYQSLKHRHSLLHDECLEAECDRDSLKNDVISLEKENEELKQDRDEMFIRERDARNELRDIKNENEKLEQENELKGDFRNFINEDIVRIKNENEQLKGEIKRLKCINKQLEERLDKDIVLNMDCGDVK